MITNPVNGKFELLSLPYAEDALAPVISAETIRFHHGKHLQAYVNNLNAALPGTPFEGMPLEEIVVKSEGGMRNNAGQTLNHNLYFLQFSSNPAKSAPTGELAAAIDRTFGSLEAFMTEFVQKGVTLFGSGWVWLSASDNGDLQITQEPNAGNPIQHGLHPLMTFDVWEHAYYLDYQNRRADQLKDLNKILDWAVIEQRYEEILK
jgi:Fe-Mn family superoxide dismutase